MSVIVPFDAAAWKQIYPEYASLSDPQLNQLYTEATIIHSNNGSWTNPITDPAIQTAMLNLLTAHLAYIGYGAGGPGLSTGTSGAGGTLVGRINSASEGSVSVGSEYNVTGNSAQWYIQTKYGATYWQMLGPYRTMRYVPGPRRIFDPIGFARGWPYGR
jgi:hypothetical protein